jgi:hypothetical protein
MAGVAAVAVAALMLATLPALASARPAPRAKKVSLVRQISKLDGQYTALRTRVKRCASAATDLRVAIRQRNAAVAGAGVGRSLANLKLRRARLAAAVVRLSRAATACTATGSGVATIAAVAGPTPGTAQVLFPDLLGGVSLDVSDLTEGLPLGRVLQVVDLSQLGGLLCTSPGVSCIGIDVADLRDAVHALVGTNLVASLLDLDLPATLATVGALLRAGDLTQLVGVQRIGDSVLRLVPLGPLAGLSGLSGVPALPVGLVDLLP